MVRAEAGDASQYDAGGHRTLAVQIEQRIGEKAAVTAQTFGEGGGQLEVLVAQCLDSRSLRSLLVPRCDPHSRSSSGAHSRPPIHRPSQAAARPSTRLTTMLATAGRIWRSSPSRWVPSIQVEKVV